MSSLMEQVAIMTSENKSKIEVTNLRLRLPKELHERLKLRAQGNNRSLNGEIVYRLYKSLKAIG